MDGYGLRQTEAGYGWFSGDDWVESSADLASVERRNVWRWTNWLGTLDSDPETGNSHSLKAVVGDTLYFTTTRYNAVGYPAERFLWRVAIDDLAIPELVQGSGPDGAVRSWNRVRATTFGVVAASYVTAASSTTTTTEAALWLYPPGSTEPTTAIATSVKAWTEHDGHLYYGRGFALRRWSPTSGVEEVFLGLMDIRQPLFDGDRVIMASAFGFKMLPLASFEVSQPTE